MDPSFGLEIVSRSGVVAADANAKTLIEYVWMCDESLKASCIDELQ